MRCPICKREVDEAAKGREGSFFPFCSERCKLIDLGRWLGEDYRVPDRAGENRSTPGEGESSTAR